MSTLTRLPQQSAIYLPAAPTAEEWTRWALESARPGEVIAALRESGDVALYPEIAALVGVPQDPEWHPEGPVDVHTGHIVNAAAEIADREGVGEEQRGVLLLAALTHDFGKPGTTRLREKRGRRRWTSYGHERAGAPLARRFLGRLGFDHSVVARVLPLVEQHMAYHGFRDVSHPERALRRLVDRLRPATLAELAWLIEADHAGRPPLPPRFPEGAARMMELAARYGISPDG